MRRRWGTIAAVVLAAYLLLSAAAGVVLVEASLRLPRRQITAEQLVTPHFRVGLHWVVACGDWKLPC